MKGEETQVRGMEIDFNKFIEENCPNLKEMPIQVHKHSEHQIEERPEKKVCLGIII